MVTFLLDTNVLAELAKQAPDPGVLARIEVAETDAAVSAVTWHELVLGQARLPPGRRREALGAFLATLDERFPVLPYNRASANWHANERARLERLGLPRAFADGQIAATAVTNGLRLVTRNLSDFAGFAGLVVESWWSE